MPTTVELYEGFGAREAAGSSALYEEFAYGVAGDPPVIALVERLPVAKRRPNLLFAAVRLVCGLPGSYAEFRRALLANVGAVFAVVRARRVQTNEVGRCTGLYPLLAALPQPLALLEVGASAGLCLFPDRYDYSYTAPTGSPVRLDCTVGGPGPTAFGPLDVAWRAGIDLNPLDVTSAADVAWLRTLVWPGQPARLARLDAAIAMPAADPPRLVRGDLNALLPSLASQAPPDATLVVFHTAVLWYLSPADRSRFAAQVGGLGAEWLSQEAAELPEYVVSHNGVPKARTAMHGGRFVWM